MLATSLGLAAPCLLVYAFASAMGEGPFGPHGEITAAPGSDARFQLGLIGSILCAIGATVTLARAKKLAK